MSQPKTTDDQPTCGKGMAANAELPRRLGDLLGALAEVLEIHMQALDLTDKSSAKENEEYRELAKQFRTTTAQLHGAAAQMTAMRDLPMGRHDFKAMSGPKPREAFEHFVSHEQELVTMLQERLPRDREMLAQMGSVAAR
jgi:hypothetical protein